MRCIWHKQFVGKTRIICMLFILIYASVIDRKCCSVKVLKIKDQGRYKFVISEVHLADLWGKKSDYMHVIHSNQCKQRYSRLKCLLRVKGLGICFYLGWSGSILQFRQNRIKVGSKSWLLTCSSI